MRIALATVQVPFIRGGAELLASGLSAALVENGHHVDTVTMPFRFFPAREVERSLIAWEAEDFTDLNLMAPDLVLPLKFPAYMLKHPRKICWLAHQHRDVYDDNETCNATQERQALRERIMAADVHHLRTCRKIFTISQTVSDRLRRYNGLDSEPLYHPPPAAGQYYSGDIRPYVFCPSRIETIKRQTLLIEAIAHLRSPVAVLFAGMGGQYGALRDLVAQRRLTDRVRLLGEITREELASFYAHALAVFFGPRDEDYGYVTLEAMVAGRAVITCSDSGGPLEFVDEGVTGRVVAPEPKAIAEAIDQLYYDRRRAVAFGRAGYDKYQTLGMTWKHVVEKLLAA